MTTKFVKGTAVTGGIKADMSTGTQMPTQKSIDMLDAERIKIEARLKPLMLRMSHDERVAMNICIQDSVGTDAHILTQFNTMNAILNGVEARLNDQKLAAATSRQEKLMNIKAKASKYGLNSVSFANNVYKIPFQGAALLVDEAVATTIIAGDVTKFALKIGEVAPEQTVKLFGKGLDAIKAAREKAKSAKGRVEVTEVPAGATQAIQL